MRASQVAALSRARCAATGLLAAAIAGGCVTLPPVEPAQLHSGRFSATLSRGGEREAFSGRFTLATAAGRITLDLVSPFGTTLARVQSDAGRATLTAPQADGTLAVWQGDSPEALAESVLGFRLPVAGLPDWIAGRAAGGRPARVTPETGPAERIEQDGWVIVVERLNDRAAVHRLTLERSADTANGTSLRLRLVLDPPHSAAATGDPVPQ